MKLYPGTVLWKVFAYKDPLHKLSGSRGDLIGRVVLISEVTTSLWGDQTLDDEVKTQNLAPNARLEHSENEKVFFRRVQDFLGKEYA